MPRQAADAFVVPVEFRDAAHRATLAAPGVERAAGAQAERALHLGVARVDQAAADHALSPRIHGQASIERVVTILCKRTKPGVDSCARTPAVIRAAQYHPAWHRCSDAARKLHARNGGQILGPELDAPARVVICWTPNGELVGGTAQALRIAADHDVPVINLGDAQWQNANADHIARAALSMLLAERGQTMTLPRVLNQRHHRTGKGTVLIDRTTPWGNPFRIGLDGSRLVVVVRYKRWLPTRPDLMAALGELRGRDLLCWCAPDLCHGNVLMPAADRPR